MTGQPYTVQIIRSRRRTLGIQIPDGAHVLIRAPLRMSAAEIRRIMEEKRDWIESHLAQAEKMEEACRQLPRLTMEEVDQLADRALDFFPQRVRMIAQQMNVRFGRITVRNQKTRWGSCSSKGNLNFNCLLMLCPPDVRDYVIVHELCHLKEMNHSPRFWAEVEKAMPDYRQPLQWLKQNGPPLLRRMTGP